MLRSQIEHCAVPVWYKHFRPITFETVFLQLTPDFLSYLLSDGVILPPSLIPNHHNRQLQVSDSESEEDEEDWEEPPQATQPDFPDLEVKIRAAIEHLGGEVFVKLNWSAPRDCSWLIQDNSLCARTPLDVILLLKGSEFIQHDLTQAFVESVDGKGEVPSGGFILTLRRFANITPAGEFRCFVRGNKLLAVSQRHHRQFLPSVVADRVAILNDLQHFFFSYIQGKFADPDYVVDVYRASARHVLLVDFNPFSRVTDPLLFTWEEILGIPQGGQPQFRVVESQEGVKGHPYSQNRVPQDVVNIGSQRDIDEFVSMFNNGKLSDASDDDL